MADNSVLTKYPFLEIKEEDGTHIRGLKSGLQLVMGLPKAERQAFWLKRQLQSEEHWLEQLVSFIDLDNRLIKQITEHMQSWDSYGKDEGRLIIANLKQNKKNTFKDIRKQRERIQWLRKQNAKPNN